MGSDGYFLGAFVEVIGTLPQPTPLRRVSGVPDTAAAADGLLQRVAAWRREEERARAQVVDAVGRARAGGASWAQVGAAVGISRQAAQERFGGASRRRGLSDARGRFSLELGSEGARPA